MTITVKVPVEVVFSADDDRSVNSAVGRIRNALQTAIEYGHGVAPTGVDRGSVRVEIGEPRVIG